MYYNTQLKTFIFLKNKKEVCFLKKEPALKE
jgi:hypothetical protein